MGDYRRQRGSSPRQQGQFGSKIINTMTSRRGREDWESTRRDNSASRSGSVIRRPGRSGWDTTLTRTKSPPAKDRRQDGAESDDDIAAKPRGHQPAQTSLPNTAVPPRVPALTQPGSHTGTGPSVYKSGAGAPPPDLVRKRPYESEMNIPAPPHAPSGFDAFAIRHSTQDSVTGQLDGPSRNRPCPPVPDTKLAPVLPALPQHRPATPPAPPANASVAPVKENTSEFVRKTPNGSAVDMASVSKVADQITAVRSSITAYAQDVETLQTTTSNHSSLISALQKRMAAVVEQADSVGDKVVQLEAAHGERLTAVEKARVAMEV